MNNVTTADRLQQVMRERGIKQTDILNMCAPFCKKYNVRLGRNDISQYASGIFKPGQKKLTVLSLALNVNEVWLMGYDVSPSRDDIIPQPKAVSGITSNRPLSTRRVPMLGEIACGEPILRVEDYENYIEVDSSFKADYCLMCKGDSMVGARINDGDIVFIRKQEMVEHGEIAAVAIDDNATLKRVFYYPEKSKIVLRAENSNYEPLVYIGEEINDITILGKAVFFQSTVK